MTPAPRTTGDLPDDPAVRSLPRLLARNASSHPELPALSWQSADGDGAWATLTWAEVEERTRRLAAD